MRNAAPNSTGDLVTPTNACVEDAHLKNFPGTLQKWWPRAASSYMEDWHKQKRKGLGGDLTFILSPRKTSHRPSTLRTWMIAIVFWLTVLSHFSTLFTLMCNFWNLNLVISFYLFVYQILLSEFLSVTNCSLPLKSLGPTPIPAEDYISQLPLWPWGHVTGFLPMEWAEAMYLKENFCPDLSLLPLPMNTFNHVCNISARGNAGPTRAKKESISE